MSDGGSEPRATAAGERSPAGADPAALDRANLRRQALWHGAAGLGAIGLWTALDAWRIVTGLVLAGVLASLASLLAGATLSHLFHEWAHYAGARLTGARAPVKRDPALLVFDFDFQGNRHGQFLASSVAGSAGNWLLVAVVALAIPLDSASRALLLATVAGGAIYTSLLEWPVIAHARRHGDALEALAHGFGRPGVFRAAARRAALAGLALWAVLLA